MSSSTMLHIGEAITEEDAAEHKLRVAKLRELMSADGFDAFIVNDTGGFGGSGWDSGYSPVRFLANFAIRYIPLTVVVPVNGEPALIVKQGFDGSFVDEAKNQSWIRNVVGLDIGRTVHEIEAYDSRSEEATALAAALREGGAAKGKIAVFGHWPAVDLLKDLLPDATFEPAPANWYPGQTVFKGGAPAQSIARGPFLAVAPLTEWQLGRLAKAADASQAAFVAYVAAARRDETMREAANAARGAAYAAGADSVALFGSVNAAPWRYWNIEMAAANTRFKPGEMYLIQGGRVAVNGFEVQIGRSFTMGDPTPAQRHLMDYMKFAVDTIKAELEIGRSGRDIYATVAPTIKREGLMEWSQYGHTHGPTGPLVSFSEVMKDWADGVVAEGQVLDVHPTLFDPKSGDHGMSGDCVAILNGKARTVCEDPLPHDFI